MNKSTHVLAMEAIQKPVTEFLRAAGFKKSGRTYNRLVDDGLAHVINFQMGRYPLANQSVTGIRQNEHGKFTVNLGIHLPCVSKIEWGKIGQGTLREYDCQVRVRLGGLAYGQDTWWPLEPPALETGQTMTGLLEKYGLPFLSTFANYESVLVYQRDHGELPFNNLGRSTLIAAIIHHKIGDLQSAADCFERSARIAVQKNQAGLGEYIEKIRRLCAR